MIKTHLFQKERHIPTTSGNYHITHNKDIIDGNRNTITLSEFNKLTRLDVKSVYVLFCLAYQRFFWPPAYWKYLDTSKDSRDQNLVNTTLVLCLSFPVESLEYPVFYLIPYFSGYLISPDGILIRRYMNYLVQANLGILGYYTFRMRGDNGITNNVLRHRMLMMAFKKYDHRVRSLHVNHIDGCPGNDKLDNLEWCTPRENIRHAQMLGLRDDTIPIEVRDMESGMVSTFPNIQSAADILNMSKNTVCLKVKSKGKISYGGYQFRYVDKNEPWSEPFRDGKYRIDFPDGKHLICGGLEAAKLLGVTRSSLQRILREGRSYGLTKNKVTKISQ